MIKFLIFIGLLVGGYSWCANWVHSGRMDQWLRSNPKSWTSKAVYSIAQTYYLLQKPKEALYYFRWFVEQFPKDESVASVRWKMAQSYEDLKERSLALEQYIILKDSYTATEYGQRANARYGQMKF